MLEMATRETWFWDLTREPDRVSLRSCINTDEVCADFFDAISPGEIALGLTSISKRHAKYVPHWA